MSSIEPRSLAPVRRVEEFGVNNHVVSGRNIPLTGFYLWCRNPTSGASAGSAGVPQRLRTEGVAAAGESFVSEFSTETTNENIPEKGLKLAV